MRCVVSPVQVLDKFGKGVGIKISAVRIYAKQLLVSLYQLARLRIVHADIKPHNILVNDGFTQVKVRRCRCCVLLTIWRTEHLLTLLCLAGFISAIAV